MGFCATSNFDIFLNFREWSYKYVVVDDAAVEVAKFYYYDVLAKTNIDNFRLFEDWFVHASLVLVYTFPGEIGERPLSSFRWIRRSH